MANAIWSLKNESGIEESSFAGMTRVEKNHFSDLFKAQESTSIAEIVRIAQYFSHFVNEEDNEELMVAISKEELKETLQSFQKDTPKFSEGQKSMPRRVAGGILSGSFQSYWLGPSKSGGGI